VSIRRPVLLAVSILLVVSGAWILNGACAFAMLNAPRADQLAAYRAIFYQRAILGLGCIILAIVVLRWRNVGQPRGE
jgi:hypothetical protein